MVACVDAIKNWMSTNHLRLNPDKTEFIWFASSHHLQGIRQDPINIGSSSITPSSSVRDLGVVFDNTLSMNDHISATVKSCFFQLHQLKHIRRSLSNDSVKSLLYAFVVSRIDYCNALFAGLPNYQLDRLQSVLNAAACLYSNTSRFAHVSSILCNDLHWLRIPERITYKLCLLVYHCLHGSAPRYLSSDCVQLRDCSTRLSGNRSAAQGNLFVPRCRTKTYGPRSFKISGPTAWNALPSTLKQDMPLPLLKSQLKSHLFLSSYH